tara:strand:- start:1105 stop:1452 length:348 start_codon:yes stop_codon:yes gene_type:complete
VPALLVVVQLDVFEYLTAHLLSRSEGLAMHRCDLEAMEGALGAGVIVAIPFGAHAAAKIVSSQHRPVQRRAILTAPNAMYDHVLRHPAVPQRYLQSVSDKFRCHAFTHRPVNDPA